MANPRKVQTEIDKLMKKVKDGMEVYDSVFEKVQSAPDKLQKEKFEAELKKEIKKLQRLREQIKLLIANPEVKDKKLLETTRRDIEIKMEAFKVCERETKTKAFSKEGLLAAKNDPALRAKLKTVNWVNDAIDELQDQIDQLEYDIENDVPNTLPMRKGKKEDPREERMARNNYHILKLESILRVLEVGDLEPEDVDEIQSDIMAYVEGLKDPSYEEDEDNDVYEVFDLPEGMVQNITGGAGGDSDSDAEEVSSPKKAEDATPPQKVAPKPAAKKSEPAAPAKAVPAPAAVPAKQQTPAGSGVTITTPAASANAKSNVASPLTAASQKTPVTPVVAKTPASAGISPSTTQGKSMAAIVAGHRAAEEAAKAAPAASPQGKQQPQQQQAAPAPVKFPPQQPQPQPQQPQPSSALEDTGLDDDADENNDDTFGDDAMDGVTPGAGSLADMSSMTTKMSGLGGASTAAGGAGDWAKPLPATVAGTHPMHGAPKLPPAGPQQASPNPVAQPRTAAPTAAAPVAPAPKSVAQPAPAAVPSVPPPSFVAPAASPPVAAPPATSVPPTAVMPPSAEVIQRMLTMSLRNLPHTSDCERPKAYAPPNPYNTPEFYPQTVHPAFSNAETFSKFDPDTLFFIFYYQQTTYQQFLAAKELKKNSWRFHKKFQTWFQRHDRPKLTTEEYEQGTYIYFDFENGWCQRIKADFVFKYQHLEDALT